MDAKTKATLEELLRLSEKDRRETAEELFSSLPHVDPDDELLEELERRWEEVQSGKAEMLPESAWRQRL